MPFFTSLMYTGTRIGGQREKQFQSFEAGCLNFPRDYAVSDTYEAYAAEREQEERERWERKPPKSRTNFEKIGTRSPWEADWTVVLGLEKPKKNDVSEEGYVTTQREVSEVLATSKPWLLRGVEVPKILEQIGSSLHQPAALLSELNRLRSKRLQHALEPNIKGDDVWSSALINVRLKMCSRGAPDDLAIIHSITDEQYKLWYHAVKDKQTSGDEDSPTQDQVCCFF